MSDPIGAGDWVETIRNESGAVPLGTVLQVSDVRPTEAWQCAHTDPPARFGVRFSNGPNPGRGLFWCGCGVRPIYRPKPDLIESLKSTPILENV